MVHSDPERFVTGAYVKVAYFAPEGAYGANRANDIIYQDEVHGPLMTQADRVVELVYTKYLKALISYEGLQRIETYMTPREGFREVILNAINHKLYESGNPIQISVFDDRIIVFNQGHWPEDIDLADVYMRKHSSYPHNPSLSHTFFNAGDIEAYGGGFAKIRIECDRHEEPYPELEVTPNGVTVALRACDLYMKLLRFGRYWQTYPAALLEDEDGEPIMNEDDSPLASEETQLMDPESLASVDRMSEILARELSEREKPKVAPIYEYLKVNEVIDAVIAMQVTGKSSSTVNRYLSRDSSLSGFSFMRAVRGARPIDGYKRLHYERGYFRLWKILARFGKILADANAAAEGPVATCQQTLRAISSCQSGVGLPLPRR